MANIFKARPSADHRAVELEQRLLDEQTAVGNNVNPARDPTSSLGRSRQSLNQGCFLVFGRVVDAIAYVRVYKVQCERGIGTLRCSDSASTGLGIVGARQINTYPVGTRVLVAYHPQALTHVIVCAVPDWMASSRNGLSDAIFQGSNVGLQADNAHYFPFTLPTSGLIDFSAGRPTDSLSAGEWGAISELGVRIILDSKQAQVAVDEMTGLLVVYDDHYARLGGINFDMQSAGYLREDRDDEGEFSSVEEYAAYTWEALGLVDNSLAAFVELTAAECQQDTTNRSKLEPIDDRQLGIYRDRTFRGYLGQGSKQQLLLPYESDKVHTYDTAGDSVVGLSEENRLIDGDYAVRSSRGIYFIKSPLIPAPKRANRPESRAGDRTDDAYASCGKFGDGPEHFVKSAPESNGEPDQHMIEPAVILDTIAYTFNWKSLHPFHYHNKDWYLAEESELDAASKMSIPPFEDLNAQTFLPAAQTFSRQVDDRYGASEYYANLALFAILPGGGIIQVDGWGAEQRSAGGTQYHHVPGDLIMTAGRNIVLQAGGDVIIKGYENVDASATSGSVRIKAKESVQVLGGNGGCGGVLIESRADTPIFAVDVAGGEDAIGGVVIKAKTSAVAILANQINLSTAAWGEVTDGHIIIDAGTWGNIVTQSYEFHRHIETVALDSFEDGATINEYWADQARISSRLIVNGDTILVGATWQIGTLTVSGSISADDYHTLSADQVVQAGALLELVESRDLIDTIQSSVELVTWFVDNSDIAMLEFYFRSDGYLRTEDFSICEPIWAQLARLGTGQVPATWQEDVVVGEDHPDSMPYPGITRWQASGGLGQHDLTLFDPVTLTAIDRGADYEAAQQSATTWVALEGNWPIVTSSTTRSR